MYLSLCPYPPPITANRTDATLDDVAFAFEDLGISTDDLFVYSRLVDSAPLPALPHYPLPRHSAHIYSPPSAPPTTSKPRPLLSEEEEEGEGERGDIIPPYFPPLPSKKMEDDDGKVYEIDPLNKGHFSIRDTWFCPIYNFVQCTSN